MSQVAKKFRGFGVPAPLFIGILASFGDDAVNTAIMPMISSLAAAFPDIPYTMVIWVYTMPKIIIIPFALLSGYIAGRYIRFKTLALMGLGIISIAGIVPALLDDFWMILASRMVLAVGLGLQAPIGPALVMRWFRNGQQRSYALGLGNGMLNGFSMLTGMLVGFLCTMDWHWSFYAYGLMVPLFLVTLFLLKEPPSAEGEKNEVQPDDREVRPASREEALVASVKRKSTVPLAAFALCAVFCLVDCFWMPASLNMSSIIVSNGWGDSATTGVVMSLISVAGLCAGFLFGWYYKLTKRFNLAVSFFLMAIALALIYFATGITMLGAGLFIGGAAFCLMICGVQNELGFICKPAQMAMATGLFMVFEHMGGFLVSGYMSLIMDVAGLSSFIAPVGVSMILFSIGGICFVFYGFRKGVEG